MNKLIRKWHELWDWFIRISDSSSFNLYLKIALTVITTVIYSLAFSWKFAILVMVAIGIHEQGHCWAMKRVGIPTRGFYFIPFLGGVAVADQSYASARDKVIVAIMGPIWGMLLALLTWVLYLITGSPILGAAAYWQGFINLFNLIPINPLDGGQIWRTVLLSLHRRVADVFSLLSVVLFTFLWIKVGSLIFAVAILLSARDFWVHWKYNPEGATPNLIGKDVLLTIVSWVVLTSILIVICGFTGHEGIKLVELFLK